MRGEARGHTANKWKVLDSKPSFMAPKLGIPSFGHSFGQKLSVVVESLDFGVKIY